MTGKQMIERIQKDPKNASKQIYVRYGSSDLLKIGKVVVLGTYMVIVAEDRKGGER